jgi:hypothetical protein
MEPQGDYSSYAAGILFSVASGLSFYLITSSLTAHYLPFLLISIIIVPIIITKMTRDCDKALYCHSAFLFAYGIPLSISAKWFEFKDLTTLAGALVFDLAILGFLALFVGGSIIVFLMEDKSEKESARKPPAYSSPTYPQLTTYQSNRNRKRRTDGSSTQFTTAARSARKAAEPFDYDVAISFAGEDREIAGILAKKLRMIGVKVFYDKDYQGNLWGKKLTECFGDIYGPKTRFVVVLISKYYPIKDWTDFEFSTMRKEAEKRRTEFILPIRLDNTKILGIHRDIGYLDLRIEGIDGVISYLRQKLLI